MDDKYIHPNLKVGCVTGEDPRDMQLIYVCSL